MSVLMNVGLKCRGQTIILAIIVGGMFFVWGVMFSLQAPFYPKEAEARGLKPSQVGFSSNLEEMCLKSVPILQYGFVFGIVHLAALVSTSIFSQFGHFIR